LRIGGGKRLALLVVIGVVSVLSSVVPALADDGRLPAYDISWPQCPNNVPPGDFEFAVIGLNNGRPFTNNPCFWPQYQWARKAEQHPDVYINVDFPRAGRVEALNGPYGRCQEADDWCRGYNWGYNLAKDAAWRIGLWSIKPEMVWLDVEVDNHWSDSPRNNAQVVRGALDYMLDFNIPVGIYGTRYQWNLITGGYQAPGMIPLWVAGARTADEAARRCDNNTNLAFAGGIIWIAQYYPEGVWDGNVVCPAALRAAQNASASKAAAAAKPAEAPVVAVSPVAQPSPAPTAPPPPATVPTRQQTHDFGQFTPAAGPPPARALGVLPQVKQILAWISPLPGD